MGHGLFAVKVTWALNNYVTKGGKTVVEEPLCQVTTLNIVYLVSYGILRHHHDHNIIQIHNNVFVGLLVLYVVFPYIYSPHSVDLNNVVTFLRTLLMNKFTSVITGD